MWRDARQASAFTGLAIALACCAPRALMMAPQEPAAVASLPHSSEPLVDADAGAPASHAEPKAAPAAMTLDEAWSWVQAKFPEETRGLRLASDDPLEVLLAWAPEGGAVTAYDRRCKPLRLVRDEDSLVGELGKKTEWHERTKIVSSESIAFASTITRYCSSFVEYERRADGRWEEAGSGGVGCADSAGFELSEVSATEVRYGGGRVDVAVTRSADKSVLQCCRDGQTLTCTLSGAFRLDLRARGGNFGFGRSSLSPDDGYIAEGADCTKPCGSEGSDPPLEAINAALTSGRFTITDLDEHPVLFRTRTACLAYRRAHRIEADSLDAW